ncbi:MAG: cation-translocating P-type ATPase [Candidatus Daviesbacteria bacterium]|nr:MAG: cation-translocating P-type ATPase [Candidatus Daviesbacteria bacterium]
MTEGLTTSQAKELLQKYGLNEIPTKKGLSIFTILLNQIKNPLFFLLLFATIISFLIGDKLDGFLILAILVLNFILGFWQEYKASKELEALQKLEITLARVLRDGEEVELPASQIVSGDMVILRAGDAVPADAQVIESVSLQINEAILTGESMPVPKLEYSNSQTNENTVFLGTTVVSGRGKVKVISTGKNTKFAGIALSLSQVEEEKTPLEIALNKLGFALIGIVAVMVGIIFTYQITQGGAFIESIILSVVLMVAAVPEGLPAVVTVVLAIGVREMYKRKALVKRLVSIENLGASTVILSDKTGTLTKNEMRVKRIEVFGRSKNDLLRASVLCNSANLVIKEDGGVDILGDTTEGSLLVFAKDQGVDLEALRMEGKMTEEVPFSLETRLMTTVWQIDGKKITFKKGAPEAVLTQTTLSKKDLKLWDERVKEMASSALRVLALSRDDKFLGLVGIADEARPEAKEAIRLARGAGIKVVMVTGDNELTAKAIGEEVGLLQKGDEILAGSVLEQMSDEDLLTRLEKVSIFARITPNQKLRLVRLYQKKGEIVAVTGDGVNDSLALKQANVGVAMGITGTDVAKEAADIVLLDDNFATLVNTIEQGRLTYSNILKVTRFLLAGNLSEISFIGLAVLMGLPTPLLPAQILWINFVTDGLPALALGFDRASPNLMKTPPRSGLNLLDQTSLKIIILGGLLIAFTCLTVFYFLFNFYNLEAARASVFTLMVILQMIFVFVIRRHHSATSNKWLLSSIIFIVTMQLLILIVEPLRILFKL